MWEQTKSWLAIIGITVLIWLVADQYVREDDRFRLTLQVVSDNPNRYASTTEPPFQVSLELTLRGRRIHLKAFADLLDSQPVLDAPIGANYPSSSTPLQVPTEELLKVVKEFAESRLSLIAVEPRAVSVLVDDYKTIPNVLVQPNYGDLKVALTDPIDRVTIQLPAFAAAQWSAVPVLRPNVEKAVRDARRPDDAFTISVPLALESLKNVNPRWIKFAPSRDLLLAGCVERQTQTRRIGPIPVAWSIPDLVQQRCEIILISGELRLDIDVRGPKDQLDRLDDKAVRAFVDILAADMDVLETEITRPVKFVLPPDLPSLELAPDSPAHEVAFKLTARKSEPPIVP